MKIIRAKVLKIPLDDKELSEFLIHLTLLKQAFMSLIIAKPLADAASLKIQSNAELAAIINSGINIIDFHYSHKRNAILIL